jgi:alkanesulfonate monooxygenase SsuD/methylene tetrahydromethanopterin reductase-like flavin-dependent oxidoreductase (luciferase family)
MGSGWNEREHVESGFPFPDARQRFELLAEQVEVVVRSWTEDSFDHKGPSYELGGQTALPRPVQRPHPPLILGSGTVKRRFAALAARYAAEVNTLGAPTSELAERKARLDKACEEAGRDPGTLRFSVMTSCFVGESRDDVHDRVARFLALAGNDADRAAFAAERADRWLVGTVDEVAARIEELRTIGVARVCLQHLVHDDDDAVALIGSRLVPAFG